MWPFRVPTEVPPVSGGVPPRFSVVIPVYQGAAFVGQAIECVLAQTVPAHEIIVVDDESTDDLQTVGAPYLARISFVRIAHGGLSAARNAGVAAATGDFIAL